MHRCTSLRKVDLKDAAQIKSVRVVGLKLTDDNGMIYNWYILSIIRGVEKCPLVPNEALNVNYCYCYMRSSLSIK